MGTIRIVGAGLAGCEAAWQALKFGHQVILNEMRPLRSTEAHQTANFAELVCSNSLKSDDPNSAPGMLKYELKRFDSLILEAAEYARVPAGQALAVDRVQLSKFVEAKLSSHPRFKFERAEVSSLPSLEQCLSNDEAVIVATGPLTSELLAEELSKVMNLESSLYFYDAIAPIIDFDSIDHEIAFKADRYGDTEDGSGDYLNIPFNKEQYLAFVEAVFNSEKMPCHDFEQPKYFECCLPIEVMIERGVDTLRFGPMKPVGITDPRTGRWPYAVLQLRAENRLGTAYSMVGFQTKMKWPEQARVFKEFVPGLAQAEFHRFGSVHRNTFINGPLCLSSNLSLKAHPRIFLAGQMTGVEGYTESSAIGALAGISASLELSGGDEFKLPPADSMIGALAFHITASDAKQFQPMNCNMGILPGVPFKGKKLPKSEKRRILAERGRLSFDLYLANQTALADAFVFNTVNRPDMDSSSDAASIC